MSSQERVAAVQAGDDQRLDQELRCVLCESCKGQICSNGPQQWCWGCRAVCQWGLPPSYLQSTNEIHNMSMSKLFVGQLYFESLTSGCILRRTWLQSPSSAKLMVEEQVERHGLSPRPATKLLYLKCWDLEHFGSSTESWELLSSMRMSFDVT